MPKEIAMVLDSYSNEIFVVRQRRGSEPPTERRRCAPGVERPPRCQGVSPTDRAIPGRARQIVMAAKEGVGTILSWVATLPCDSRERLRSKEHELALLGISWTTDSVHDAALAREIEVARQRRQAASEVAPGVAAEVRPSPSSLVARADRRISIAGTPVVARPAP